jgi:large subunit ribosomal protein L9
MKVILTQKMARLGDIGDTVEVASGYARNYLLPKGRAMRWSKENVAAFESQRADLLARHESAKKNAESDLPKVMAAKLYLIRSAGDTGHLYGSVSSRDIARLVAELSGVQVASEQVLLPAPIKEIGTWNVKVVLHPDVIADVKVYVAQTEDEIEALVAGKSIKRETKRSEQPDPTEQPAEPAAQPAE